MRTGTRVIQGSRDYQQDAHSIYQESPSFGELSPDGHARAMQASFATCHRLFGQNSSGSTLTHVAVTRDMDSVVLRTAHVGDSPAYYFVVNPDGKVILAQCVINDHNPLPDTTEYERIKALLSAKGERYLAAMEQRYVVDGRIYSELAMTRSIGDKLYDVNEDGDFFLKDLFLPQPELVEKRFALQPGQKLVVVAASDGLVERMRVHEREIEALLQKNDIAGLDQGVKKILKVTLEQANPRLISGQIDEIVAEKFARFKASANGKLPIHVARILVDLQIECVVECNQQLAPDQLAKKLITIVGCGKDNTTVIVGIHEHTQQAQQEPPSTHVLAVYDGHGNGGATVSQNLEKHFPMINAIYLRLEALRASGDDVPNVDLYCGRVERYLNDLSYTIFRVVGEPTFQEKLAECLSGLNNPDFLTGHQDADRRLAVLKEKIESIDAQDPNKKYFLDLLQELIKKDSSCYSPKERMLNLVAGLNQFEFKIAHPDQKDLALGLRSIANEAQALKDLAGELLKLERDYLRKENPSTLQALPTARKWQAIAQANGSAGVEQGEVEEQKVALLPKEKIQNHDELFSALNHIVKKMVDAYLAGEKPAKDCFKVLADEARELRKVALQLYNERHQVKAMFGVVGSGARGSLIKQLDAIMSKFNIPLEPPQAAAAAARPRY